MRKSLSCGLCSALCGVLLLGLPGKAQAVSGPSSSEVSVYSFCPIPAVDSALFQQVGSPAQANCGGWHFNDSKSILFPVPVFAQASETDLLNEKFQGLDEDNVEDGEDPVLSATQSDLEMHEVSVVSLGDGYGVETAAVVSGYNQFSCGYGYNGNRKHHFTVGLRFGLDPQSELGVKWDPFYWNNKTSGRGNASFSYKRQFCKGKVFSFAGNFEVEFPTDGPPFSDKGIMPSLNLSYSWKLSPAVSFSLNTGVALKNPWGTEAKVLQPKVGGSLGFLIDPEDYVFVSLSCEGPDKLGGGIINCKPSAGWSRTLNDTDSLNLTVKPGITRVSDHIGLDFGYTHKF